MRTPLFAIPALLLCAIAPAATTVTAAFRDPAGAPVTGTCIIQAVGRVANSQAWTVINAPFSVPFTAGAFSVDLAPTDVAPNDGQFYRVNCNVPYQTAGSHKVQPYNWGPEYWQVPTSLTALDVGAVRVSLELVSPSLTSTLARLFESAAAGSCIKLIDGVPAWSSPCVGGSSLTWPALTSSAWSTLTASSWATLTGGSGGSSLTWSTLTGAAWSGITSSAWSTLTQ